MPWKKDDFLAALLIGSLIVAAALIAYINWEQATQGGVTWFFR